MRQPNGSSSPGAGDAPTVPGFAEAVEYADQQIQAIALDELRAAGVYRTPLEYYLVGTYPPLKYLHDIGEDEVFRGVTASQNLYLHIPFCEQYCTFCHFYKEINAEQSWVDRYVAALLDDISAVGQRVSAQSPQGLNASSVYFGGGTPSYLRAHQITRLFEHLWKNVRTSPDTEITFELHPGVVRQPDYEDRLDAIAAGGVNRWVFGIQSMDPDVLVKLNRGHGRDEVYRLLGLLEQRGIDNLNVDLIFGLPLQNLRNWYDTLTELMAAGIEKFNIFPLMFKRSDPITRQYMRNPELFPDATDRLRMHYMAEFVLSSAGFVRGPVFYYAKGRVHSQQQQNKFDSIEEDNLVALGVSGFGYIGGTQYYNLCDNRQYVEAIAEGRAPVWRGHTLPNEERARRAVMFGIRSGGVDFDALGRHYEIDAKALFSAEIARLERLGLVTVDGSRMTLTDLGCTFVDGIGYLFASDEVTSHVAEANELILSPSQDPVDRYDYSPIGRLDLPGGIADHYRDGVRA
ncbi:coproporphyrinogen III oxidase family protein [Saccharopolyspora erythraea]|uniref:coproporphyrinogen-III oxidase family protein n=1 Tax=Saccharopolyspora erythraea TaxID=1836 RepID=UPI001BAA476B|nr:coproporphyrinogen-III oxidase family protein [Saccharopolyspora erythraea]QUH03645.1 coproporphyrinogen III oxidase family protein [Saccharopolyspora erythraea]